MLIHSDWGGFWASKLWHSARPLTQLPMTAILHSMGTRCLRSSLQDMGTCRVEEGKDFSYPSCHKALFLLGTSLASYCVWNHLALEVKGSKARKDEQEQICTRKHEFCAKEDAVYSPIPESWGNQPRLFLSFLKFSIYFQSLVVEVSKSLRKIHPRENIPREMSDG